MLDFSDILSLFRLCRNLVMAEMPSEKRMFMKNETLIKNHPVVGGIASIAWNLICMFTGAALAFAYAVLITLPAAIAASKVANEFLAILVLSFLFVLNIVLTGPIFMFVKEFFLSFTNKVYFAICGEELYQDKQ